MEEQDVRARINEYAERLHVRMPTVRFVNSGASPGYDPLFNRIELSHAMLRLPSLMIDVIIAHELGHAAQRRALVLDMLANSLCKGFVVLVPGILYAWTPHHGAWDIVIPMGAFVLAYSLYVLSAHARALKRGLAFEIEADKSAAILCGVEPTLRTLETLSTCGRIRLERLAALHAKLLNEQRCVDASQRPGKTTADTGRSSGD